MAIQVSERVLWVLRYEKISEEELAKMLRLAVNTRVRGFNKRYCHWIFKVNGDHLEEMQWVDLLEVGKGKTKMLEEHDSCNGEGCHTCGWSGQVARWITDRPLPKHEPGPQYLRRRG